jgi:hypothetical protein
MPRNHRRIVRAKSQYWELIVPPAVAKPPLKREGIRRHAGPPRRQGKPLTELHLAVLAQLSDVPKGATEIGWSVRTTRGRITSALYSLALRDLASNQPGKGWIATPNPLEK